MRGKINQVNLTREPQHKNGKYCFQYHLCYIRVYNSFKFHSPDFA